MDPNSSNRPNSKGKTWPRGICAFAAYGKWVNTKPNMRKMDRVRVCPIDQIDRSDYNFTLNLKIYTKNL